MSRTARIPHARAGGSSEAGVGPQAALQGDHQLPRSGLIPVLAQPDTLPRAQCQASLADGQCQRRAQKTGFDVGRLQMVKVQQRQCKSQ